MTCNCDPPRVLIGTPYQPVMVPLSAQLQTPLNITQATERRELLCSRWGIINKSHKQHGSNFSGSQTLAQLINNIVEPLQQGTERERVRGLVLRDFDYDIDTRMMQ